MEKAIAIAEQFFECANDMSTSDLQDCIGAEISKLGLGQWEAFELEGMVFDVVLERHAIQ